MMGVHSIRGMGSLVLVGVLALACGSEEDVVHDTASSWDASRSAGATSDGTNRAPEIVAIDFEPSEARPGRVLRARVRAEDPDRDMLELGFTWKINGARIAADGASIEVPQDLRGGDRIELVVIASDGEASSAAFSASLSVGNRAPRVSGLDIQVVPEEDSELGSWLAEPSAEDPDGDSLTYRFEWWRNGEQLVGEGETLSRDGWERGDEIHLVVWASDGKVESTPFESAPFSVGNSPPEIVSRPPAMDPSGRFVYRVESRDRDGDRDLRHALVQGPRGMVIDAVSGELQWTPAPQDSGEHVVEIAVDDRHGGVTRQTFYLMVESTVASRR